PRLQKHTGADDVGDVHGYRGGETHAADQPGGSYRQALSRGSQPPQTRAIGVPPKSVSFSWRPLCRYHSLFCSRPSRCRIVAWKSRMWYRSPTAFTPSSSVSPITCPPLTPPPANHIV